MPNRFSSSRTPTTTVKPYVLDLLAAVAIDRMVLGDDMHW